jgi:hypothetical protein
MSSGEKKNEADTESITEADAWKVYELLMNAFQEMRERWFFFLFFHFNSLIAKFVSFIFLVFVFIFFSLPVFSAAVKEVWHVQLKFHKRSPMKNRCLHNLVLIFNFSLFLKLSIADHYAILSRSVKEVINNPRVIDAVVGFPFSLSVIAQFVTIFPFEHKVIPFF